MQLGAHVRRQPLRPQGAPDRLMVTGIVAEACNPIVVAMEQLVREEYRHLCRRFDAVDHLDAEDERRACTDHPPCAVHVPQRNHQIDWEVAVEIWKALREACDVARNLPLQRLFRLPGMHSVPACGRKRGDRLFIELWGIACPEYIARVQLRKFRNHIRPERSSLLRGSCLCEALDQRPETCGGIDHAAACGGRGICRYEKGAHQGGDGASARHRDFLTL